ncbi:MAG: right-handed parallel beta-helix repeat-containing protein [Methanotrichaceae archaeon]|nr:right-handed parallel beta-helix repeat-containing protein [Methanotrichaceae archaeon]
MIKFEYRVSELTNLAATALTIIFLAFSAQAATITVCQTCENSSIQAAIDASKPNDIIEIKSGTYYEQLNITKPIRLQGVNTGTGMPIVDGGKKGIVIILSADAITLEGLIIKGSSPSDPGIKITSNGNAIKNSDISYQGKDGIILERSSNNVISGNFLSYNGKNAIYLKEANNNIIRNNSVSYNLKDGFYAENSASNRFEHNVAAENKNGITLDRSSNNALIENEFKSNSQNGVNLDSCRGNTLQGNNASYNYNGIYLLRSTDNLVTENYATKNMQNGIRLVSSVGNILSLNRLVANREDVYDDGDANLWYSSEAHKGNFYSEYQNCTDTDSNGICERAYLIPGGSGSDAYPLATSFLKELSPAIQSK